MIQTLDRNGDDKSSANEPMSTWEIIKSSGVPTVLYLYGHVMLLALGYTAVIPVFWFSQPALGGYGFTPFLISIFLGAAGLSQAIWLLLAFPPLQHRFGTGGVLRGCSIIWPMTFIFAALGTVFLRHDWKVAFWILLSLNTVMGSGVSMAFTAVQLALNDIAPSPQTLGTLNALALTLVSGLRAVAPALFASIFATGARTQILDGYLVWYVLVLLALALTVTVRWLPEKAEGKLKEEGNLG